MEEKYSEGGPVWRRVRTGELGKKVVGGWVPGDGQEEADVMCGEVMEHFEVVFLICDKTGLTRATHLG